MPPLIVRACGSPARRGGGDHFCERGASDAAAEETDGGEKRNSLRRDEKFRENPRDCAFANREPRTVNVQSQSVRLDRAGREKKNRREDLPVPLTAGR